MLGGAVLWRLAVLAAWVGGLIGLFALDTDQGSLYVGVGVPLTVLVGALVDRWWATVAPFAIAVAVVAVNVVAGTTCPDCNDGEGPALWITILLAVFAVPASGALAAGVMLRRFGRSLRGHHT